VRLEEDDDDDEESTEARETGRKVRSGSGAAGARVTGHDGPYSRHAILTAIILTITMTIAIAIPGLDVVFGLSGATCTVVVTYVMPSLILCRARRIKDQADEEVVMATASVAASVAVAQAVASVEAPKAIVLSESEQGKWGMPAFVIFLGMVIAITGTASILQSVIAGEAE
jgi:hypothetical protein